MNEPKSILNTLIDVDDCLLAVIDVQDSFLKKCSCEEADLTLDHVGWLVEVAKILGVPMVVTAEEIERMGGVSPTLAEKLPPGTTVFNKMVFNLADNPEILQAVKDSRCNTIVLVGLETDVCIAQSALGLLQHGYQVVAVADATHSPGEAHTVGLERMRRAGVLVTSVKALYYEWIRTVEMSNRIPREHGAKLGRPRGVIL